MADDSFDPAQYLAEKTGATAPPSGAAQGFDPAKYLAEKTGQTPAPSFDENHPTIARYRDAAINALPGAGAMVGGVLGAPEGGVGAIPGAALGGVAGNAAKRLAEGLRDQGVSYLTNKPTVDGSMQAVKDTGYAGLEGAGQEMGGQVIGKGLSALKTGAKASAQAIKEAAERLGIKATPGMVNSSPVVQGLESSLAQSPTYAGDTMRQTTNPVKQGLQEAAKDVLSSGSGKSSFKAGGDAANNLISDIGEKYNNVQMAYEPFNQELPKMKPNPEDNELLQARIKKAGEGNLSLSSDISSWSNKVAAKIEESKSLADVEEVRKQVSATLNKAYRDGDYNAVDGISKVEDHLNNFRDNQFEKLASKNGPSEGDTKYKISSPEEGRFELKSPGGQGTIVQSSTDQMHDYDPTLEQFNVKNPYNLEHIESNKPGFGSKILTQLEKKAQSQGADSVYLNASPLGENKDLPRLINFYQQNGYQVVNHEGGNAVMFKMLPKTPIVTGETGPQMGQDMVSQYKQAQGKYADLMTQLKEVGPALGIKVKNPKGFIESLNNIPEEKLADTLSQTKFVRAAQTIQNNFPEVFENIKKAKLGQIAEKSSIGGDLDPGKLIRETKKLSPEFKQMLFGDKASKLDDMETVISSLPAKMGPSGTPQGMEYKDLGKYMSIPAQVSAKGGEGIYKTLSSPSIQSKLNTLTSPVIQNKLTGHNINPTTVGTGLIGRGIYEKGKSLLGGE